MGCDQRGHQQPVEGERPIGVLLVFACLTVAIAAVLWGLNAARQQVTEFAKLTHGIKQALTQAVNVSTALHGWNQVNVAFAQYFTAFRQP